MCSAQAFSLIKHHSRPDSMIPLFAREWSSKSLSLRALLQTEKRLKLAGRQQPLVSESRRLAKTTRAFVPVPVVCLNMNEYQARSGEG